jgi:hypothetical protein
VIAIHSGDGTFPARGMAPCPVLASRKLPEQIDTIRPACKSPLRLVAMIETEDTIKKIRSAVTLN